MGDGVEVPALVFPSIDRMNPAHRELAQENPDEHEVVEQEMPVYGVVESGDGRHLLSKEVSQNIHRIEGIKKKPDQIDDQQHQHQHIQREP